MVAENQDARNVVVHPYVNINVSNQHAKTVEELGECVSMDAKNPNAKTVEA